LLHTLNHWLAAVISHQVVSAAVGTVPATVTAIVGAVVAPTSGQIVGERGGTAFSFRFWWRNAVPLAYTMTASYLQHKQQKKMCVKCMI